MSRLSPLSPAALRWTCDPARFNFITTAELPPGDLLTQQERPLRALEFALGMRRLDYNVYVAGPPGLGKTRTVLGLLQKAAALRPPPADLVYVFNFQHPDRPKVLRLPSGTGRSFSQMLQTALERLKEDIQRVMQADPLATRREAIVADYEHKRDDLTEALRDAARERGFELRASQLGPFAAPIPIGEEVADEAERVSPGEDLAETVLLEEVEVVSAAGDELAARPEEQEESRRRRSEVIDQLNLTLRKLSRLTDEVGEELKSLQRDAGRQAILPALEPLRETFAEEKAVLTHLDAMVDDMLDHLDLFLGDEEEEEGEEHEPREEANFDTAADALFVSLRRYRANVIVDHAESTGAPVVIESHPTYANLLGRIEQEATQGVLSTHFLMIKAGALHRAIGGFLVLRVDDLLSQPEAYSALTRALRDQELRLEDPQEGTGPFSTRWLKPEPVPLEGTRVILTGGYDTMEALLTEDPEFEKLFKVRAEFDEAGPRESLLDGPLPGFISRLCLEEKLKPFDRGAVAALAEEAVRLAEDQTRLSTRQQLVADVAREAEYWARRNARDVVTGADVEQALMERIARSDLPVRQIRDSITRGFLILKLQGMAVGQVNGLVVADSGNLSFGWPARVTARVSAGGRGVIALDREVGMGESIYGKSVLILDAYLRSTYAVHVPLSLAVSIVMEQNYSLIAGDSASGVELCAVLSALADVPLQQGLAMTGAMDQFGVIQPIGGVNEKIEGMFAVCKAVGLTGHQGVIIPARNIPNLQLSRQVVEAAQAGQFQVYAVETIEEALTLLTGSEVGHRTPTGEFPPGSFNARVEQRLLDLAAWYSRYRGGSVAPDQEPPHTEPQGEQALKLRGRKLRPIPRYPRG